MKSLDEAIDYFNQALDRYFETPDKITDANFPEYLKAFEAIDKICTGKKDWKNAGAQLPQDAQAPAERRARARSRSRCGTRSARSTARASKEFNAAIQAFEVAAQLDPNNAARHEILAELYVMARAGLRDEGRAAST